MRRKASQVAGSEAGTTIVETLLTIALAMAVAGFAVTSLAAGTRVPNLDAGLRTTAGFVRLVRALAVSQNTPARLVVTAGGRRLAAQVERGGVWSDSGHPLVLEGSTVVAVAPQQGIVFLPTGTTTALGTVSLQNSYGDSEVVRVSLLGSVRIGS